MVSSYDKHYSSLRGLAEKLGEDTVVAENGPPLFQPHPYIENEQTSLCSTRSFRSEAVDEDLKTIKKLVQNNFLLFKAMAEKIDELSQNQNRMSEMIIELHEKMTEIRGFLQSKINDSKIQPKPKSFASKLGVNGSKKIFP